MLNLQNSDIAFIKKNMGEDSILLKIDDAGEFLDLLYVWIDDYGFDETGENYNTLGREAQRLYDYVYEYC